MPLSVGRTGFASEVYQKGHCKKINSGYI